MRTSDAHILIIPGLGDSEPDHWQSRWQAKLSSARRVEQTNWDAPVLADWTGAIVEAARAAENPVVLIAHSLGCLAVAHAAPALAQAKIAGAFLVCPTSEARLATLPQVDPAFAPIPRVPLGFPAWLVASRTDPNNSFEHFEACARDWEARLVDAGNAGHINVASGHGPWPEGLLSLAGFLKTL